MGLKSPSTTIVVDANIIISGSLGRRGSGAMSKVANQRLIATTLRTVEEVAGVLGDAVRRGQIDENVALLALRKVTVIDPRVSADFVAGAADVLRLAPPSRNGSERDAHLLALAWALDADIWSHDRDFAGTGWPSWSTANLIAALGDA